MSTMTRRSAYNLLYATAAIAVLGACSASRGELRASVAPDHGNAVRAEISAPAATRMIARANGVDVIGQLELPSACHRIATDVERQDKVVTLTVRSEADPAQGRQCMQGTTARKYTAEIRGLVPGEYLVRVVHDSASSGTRTVAQEQVAGR